MHRIFFILFIFFSPVLSAQDSLVNKPSTKKLLIVSGANIVLWSGTYLILNKAWYGDYTRESFHFFNDNDQWNQMDKAGHTWTAYHISRFSGEMWKWTGLSHSTSVLLGVISGMAYESIIEIQDGYSSEWGFSWGDMAANLAGASLYAAQELTWKEQRLQLKMSYWNYDYSEELKLRRDELFGNTLQEQLLKDYNAQTYWISGNLHSFFKHANFPKWLNISLGYSSDGMLGGTENKWKDKAGIQHDRTDIKRVRHFFIAPDVDLTRIRTRSKLLKGVFFALHSVKFPAPAIEFDSQGKLKLHAVYF